MPQHEIKRQRKFKMTKIDYDRIKNEIASAEHVY